MITAGILAANGGLSIYLVILAGTIGGMLGDNIFYALGRRFGPRLADRVVRGGRGREFYRWVRRQIEVRGATIIFVGRLIPAGRTVTTFLGDLHRAARVHRRQSISRRAVAAIADRARRRLGAGSRG
jgi:membrane protein DedA with SNARE-associated domain